MKALEFALELDVSHRVASEKLTWHLQGSCERYRLIPSLISEPNSKQNQESVLH
jgi:hypothetical protein